MPRIGAARHRDALTTPKIGCLRVKVAHPRAPGPVTSVPGRRTDLTPQRHAIQARRSRGSSSPPRRKHSAALGKFNADSISPNMNHSAPLPS